MKKLAILILCTLSACGPTPEVYNRIQSENSAADQSKCNSMGFKGKELSNCLLELHKARVEVCGKTGETDSQSLRIKRLYECIPVNYPDPKQ